MTKNTKKQLTFVIGVYNTKLTIIFRN